MNRRGQSYGPISRPFRVTEIFTSIQGESSRAGLPTTFIRLTGCGLRCRWCDTTHAFAGGELVTAADLVERVQRAGLPHVCLTGGEPLEHEGAGALMLQLAQRGLRVSLETGGHCDIGVVPPEVSVVLDLKCPGSGMQARNRWENLGLLRGGDEIKFVLSDEGDYRWARTALSERPIPAGVGILLSPVHAALDPRDLVAWVVRDRLPVRVNLQLHKFVWGPEAIGV